MNQSNMGRHKKEIIKEVPEQIQTESKPDKNMKFYLVVYLTDGTIHLWPGDSKEECEKTKVGLSKSKWKPRIKTFRFIKRDLNKCKDGYIL